jgi:hypothetical protein
MQYLLGIYESHHLHAEIANVQDSVVGFVVVMQGRHDVLLARFARMNTTCPIARDLRIVEIMQESLSWARLP